MQWQYKHLVSLVTMYLYSLSLGLSNSNLNCSEATQKYTCHDDVIKWKHFPRYWPFLQGIHLPSVNSLHRGQWRGALMFSLICALNKRLSKQSLGWWFETQSAHFAVIVMENWSISNNNESQQAGMMYIMLGIHYTCAFHNRQNVKLCDHALHYNFNNIWPWRIAF